MQAQAISGFTAAPESFALVGRDAEALARAAQHRFEHAIQSVLDSPLDTARVLEWTRLRAVVAGA